MISVGICSAAGESGDNLKPNPPRVRLVKTLYPHWGRHTAFNAVLPHFDDTFHVTLTEVPLRGLPLTLPERLLEPWLRRKGVQAYAAKDLGAEIALFCSALFSATDIIMLLDAEHSLLFLPRWFRVMGAVKKPPKIIAMFHQPPAVLEKIINVDIAGQADHILVVAPAQAEFFARHVPADRISTILLGVDIDYFRPPLQKTDEKKFKCLSGGVWLRDYRALFATAELFLKDRGVEFHLVAPRALFRQAPANIRFHEAIPDDELLQLYQSADLLFLPLQDATANTFLLEGAACGLPILSTDLPSVAAYFPGPEALRVRDNNPEEFAAHIDHLRQNREQLTRMSAAARLRAEALSWETIARQYRDLFRRMIITD